MRKFLAESVSVLAILCFFSGNAYGQDQSQNSPQVESADRPGASEAAQNQDIIVTGSRIASAGYKQPTPVTVVSEVTLERDSKTTVGDSIRELPAVGSSSSPNNGGGGNNIVSGVTGLDTVNLRQLGLNRTLILIDGQRVVNSTVTGTVDLGTVPQILVNRVDVVTGGASAAWGSDAVAGVVNLVFNKNFDGLKVQAEAGQSYRWDRQTYRVSGAFGTSFADGRGRVIVAGNYYNSPDTIFGYMRPWNTQTRLVPNSAYTTTNGQPRLIHMPNVGVYRATTGGVITGPVSYTATVGGISATRPNPLLLYKFTGNGQISPYTVDYVSGTAVSSGGDTDQLQSQMDNLVVPYHTATGFGYASYELTDHVKASFQYNYGTTWSQNSTNPAVRLPGAITVQLDNAFLPSAVKTAVQSVGGTSVQVATTNVNNITSAEDITLDSLSNTVGVPVAITKRKLNRFVAGLEGDFGPDWTWNAYYQNGRVQVRQRTTNDLITANYAFAIDAVDQGLYQSGVANGNIVCRATVTGKTTYNAAAAGCVPLNIFGTNVASQGAIDYVNTRTNFQVTTLKQQNAALSFQGKLPFGLPAGNISVAFGGEYRKESASSVVDAGAQARLYAFANFSAFRGKYDVKEAFLETEVPILEDSVVESLTLNAAGRVTDYSTSGTVKTWKIGAVSQIDSNIRVRALLSQDIRAPNLSELFATGTSTVSTQVDPRQNNPVSLFSVASGNPNLKPERAKTFSAGLVLTPSFAPRLQASIDYYSISINGAIYTVGASQVLANCNAGVTSYCSQLVFAGPAITTGPNIGQASLSAINTFPLNVSADKTSGIDFQLDYSHPFGSGDLQFKLVGNYVISQKQTALGVSYEYRGSLGNDSAVVGVPQARMTGALTYNQGPVSFTVQSRFIGAAKINNAWGPLDVDDNSIPAIAYVDLRGSWQVNDNFQVYGAIDNLFQKSPPNVPRSSATGNGFYTTPTVGTIYDTIGGTFRVGVRAKF